MTQTLSEVQTLSLRDLHQALNDRGVKISYSALSELIGTGDITEQLMIEGGGNGRRIQPPVVGILAEFLPRYRGAKGRLPQAPDMLRAFLVRGNPESNGSGALVHQAPAVPMPLPDLERLCVALERAERTLLSSLEAHTRVLSALPAPEDALLSAEAVRALVPMSAAWLKVNVPSVKCGRRRLWRRSEVLRFIAHLQ